MYQGFFDWLFPTRCLLCHDELQKNQQLCTHCLNDIEIILLPESGNLLHRPDISRLFDNLSFDALFALSWYQPPVENWIRGLKFHDQIHYKIALIQLIRKKLPEYTQLEGFEWPDYFVVLPLHPSRFKNRGFNQVAQVWEPLLPKHLISHTLLTRNKATQAQTTLTKKQRKQNLKSAFKCETNLQGKKITIIDDVITTGATINSAADCLKQAGAIHVSVWATCITPFR
ncbi:ComF family protein [Pseudoalteromonas ulvae]|uniref:Uncharacterized protein n=1 Tax=Pseudoalteromonas ulvae TaxID=107327 RepID=A0A244CWC8_PSEDV|nr:ComF family protein [Pseudoalteromonas ulvae]OUL59736.1 hypothetical protein B1199_05850 [Pseudoalteromonas ulvae]